MECVPVSIVSIWPAAIDVGYEMVREELLAKIGETVDRHHQDTAAQAAGGAAS